MIFANVNLASAQEITAIDFNGALIGKVIPDGKVVSFDNRLIGNITADSLILNSSGKLIGGVVPQGVAIGNDNRMLGKVSSDGAVRLATGKIVGKVLPNGLVVDEKFDILGAVLFPGLIYADDGKTVGRLTGDGVYTNLQGQNIGFVSSDGYAYRRSGNDYVLDGRLVSSKMVIDLAGKFIGNVSPGGKITDFDGKQIGFIKANGFAYNSDNKVIGSVVRSGYAFSNAGKYIGLVTFNGEVINGEKLIGYLQSDGNIADTKGNIIGFMVNIASTAADSSGQYLGRVMPEGKIAKGTDIIGQLGPWNVIYDKEGKQIGQLIQTGPIFDYRGELRGHSLKNGQVVTVGGAPLGTIRGDFAVSSSGSIIGAVLKNKVIFNGNNQALGITGINSTISVGNDNRIISPLGYVYTSDGKIDGNAFSLGSIFDLGGKSVGAISPNGDIINNGISQGGHLTQYGYNIDEHNSVLGGKINTVYAVTSTGQSVGILADGNQVLNKGLHPIGKVLPDNSVVAWSEKASYMPVNGFGSPARLAMSYDGKIIGIIDNQGQVKDSGASTIGKVNSSGIIFDNSGAAVGEAVDFMSVVNDKCELVGTITPTGEVKNYREVNMGRILPNSQVISDNGAIIGFGVSRGVIIDFGGKPVGTTSSDGRVLNYANDNLGCINSQNRLYNKQKSLIGKIVSIVPVIDFNNKIVGRSMLDGRVIDNNNQDIGYVMPDDSVNSKTSSHLGMLFRYRYAFNNANRLMGTVNDKGEVIDSQGKNIGSVDFDGNVKSGNKNIGYALYDIYVYNDNNNAIGYIAPDGGIISFSNQHLAKSIHGFAVSNSQELLGRGNRDFHIRNKNNDIIGELMLNGNVISQTGEVVGSLGEEGNIINPEGEIIAKATPLQYYIPDKRKLVYDKEGNPMGYDNGKGQVVDENGNIVAILEKDGKAVDASGVVIGHLDWFKHPEKEKPSSSEPLPKVGSRPLEERDYKRSANIALDLNGNYLGDIVQDKVINPKTGKIEGVVEGDLVHDPETGEVRGRRIRIPLDEVPEEPGTPVAPKPGASNVFVPGNKGYCEAHGLGDDCLEQTPATPGQQVANQQAQAIRRQGMFVGSKSTTFSREYFDGKQKDWGITKVISTLPVDMDMMILADKPIPAVISRPIDTEHEAPVTAYVERNVYAEDGRNVIIPAGSHLIGSTGGESGGQNSARISIIWERLITPKGVMFDLSSAKTGDAQGRGGVLGYLDRQLVKKYSTPLVTSIITNGISVLFSTEDSSKGGENSSETSKQQATNDARQNFLDDTKQMFEDMLDDYMKTKSVVVVPAGTRIIVFPKVDLWLKTMDDFRDEAKKGGADESHEYENSLFTEEDYKKLHGEERNSSSGDSSPALVSAPVTYAPDNQGRTNVGATPPPPPPSQGNSSRYNNQNNRNNEEDSDVPQLF